MSVRPSQHGAATPDTASTSQTSSTSERRVTADSLDLWLARDWSDAVHVSTLPDFQQIHVCTRNTLYELVVVSTRGDVRVRGGRYFPDWTAARLAGCTAGGSFLRRHTIAPGMQMEIEIEGRRIITSPVRTIALLQSCLSPDVN
jgi:hypothetical protein